MKRFLLLLLLMAGTLGFTAEALATDRWEILRAINWVENPTNHSRAGRFGELGPYQFRSGTWRMHTNKPFQLAVQRSVADEVAVKHYEWIRRELEKAGVEANAFNIAMAWNCGVNAVLAGRAPSASYNYAVRVSNLVETFQNRPPAVAADAPWPARRDEVETFNLTSAPLRFRVLRDVPRFDLALN